MAEKKGSSKLAKHLELKAKVLDPKKTPFEQLVTLLSVLRSAQGCAWDRKQTHRSLVPYLIEEAYEVIDAIEADNPSALREELGDLLCQIVFHAQIASESKSFSMDDAIQSIVNKLIERHPHVFEQPADLEPQQVRDQWEQIKSRIRENSPLLGNIPKSMPALTMAFRIGEKAGGVGFDWQTAEAVLDKIREETQEVATEMHATANDPERAGRLTSEIGDLLFAVASLSRKMDIDPEAALKSSMQKFISRFAKLEERVKSEHGDFSKVSLDQMENLWQMIKRQNNVE